MMRETHLCSYESPLGPLALELDDDRCVRVLFKRVEAPFCSPDHPAAVWLRAYFTGRALSLPKLARAETPFQARLRKALLAIPRGKAKTYGELAQELGTSPRALGQALGANPLPIIVPCHRVVAAHGLGGFGGGTEWKKRLLEFERAI